MSDEQAAPRTRTPRAKAPAEKSAPKPRAPKRDAAAGPIATSKPAPSEVSEATEATEVATKAGGQRTAGAQRRGNGSFQKPEYTGLRQRYHDEVQPALQREFGYANPMQIPRVEKVIVNIGLGEAIQNAKAVDAAVGDLAIITGQRPIVTRAKRSIAQFRLRTGMPIGAKVTLRKTRMYEFLDRLVNIALPRVRDFRGCNPKSFDGRGNYALGIKEHIIFPEIDYDKTESILGMDIIVCTTAKTDDEARALLREFNFPFRQ